MPGSESRKPNVIVFFTDQQRWDTTGLHGNPLDLTPNFDRMARRGTHVRRSFTCQPVCGPARSCLQTGLHVTRSGCFRNGIPLPSHLKTLAHHFGGAGYAHRIHRQVAPLRRFRRAGARRAPRRIRLLAGIQHSRVHLRFLPDHHVRQRQPRRRPPRLPGRRGHRRHDPLRRRPPGAALLPLHLLHRAPPPEPPGRLSAARRLPGALQRQVGPARPGGPGWIGAPPPGRLFRHGEETGRSPGAAAGRTHQPRSDRPHHRAIHLRSRLPFQDPQRRVQTVPATKARSGCPPPSTARDSPGEGRSSKW